MSEVLEKSIKCDVCSSLFRNAGGQPVRKGTARDVRVLARAIGWKCRAWTAEGKMIDACPRCRGYVKWGRGDFITRAAENLLRRASS